MLRERQIYSVLDRVLAVVQIVFGFGLLIALVIEAVTPGPDRRPLEVVLGIVVAAITIVAGVLLWRGRRAGLALSLGVQLFQVLPVIVAHTAVRYVAGLHWTLRFGGARIWQPWGLEGTFIILHDDRGFPTTVIGLNVVALVAALYLVGRLKDLRKTQQ